MDIPDTAEEVGFFVDCVQSKMPMSDQKLDQLWESTTLGVVLTADLALSVQVPLSSFSTTWGTNLVSTVL